MKDVAIVESGKEFKFSGTGKLETELQNGGSCYWVPKDERETGHIFASENRDYTADEISKYGISSVDVNIFFTGITDDGEPWSVTIDPDTELPIIDIGDIEITIDDIGDIDIHIPGGDPDEWPGWDDLDPDLKEDFDDWVNPHDPDDWPGWDDLDPSIKDDFDDWVNDGNDPDEWPGWDDLDPSIKDDFDGFVNPHDPDSWPGWGDLDPGIKDNFDDWTSDIDTSIDDSMLEDMGIDIDDNIDISVDDLGNIDISNGDISVNLDPITGEWDTGDCPASIKIMHVPNKTEYTDGLAIDYDGLVVQAFDADGNVWSSSEYPDGYIPAHELNVAKYADISASKEIAEISDDYNEITQEQINKIASPESVANMFSDNFNELSNLGASEIQSKFAEASAGAPFCYAWCDGGIEFGPRGGAGYTVSGMWCGIVVPVSQSGNILQCVTTAWDVSFAYFPEGVQYFNLVRGHSWITTWPLFVGTYPWGNSNLKSSINADSPNVQNIDVGFTSPCLTDLTATFGISVTPKENHDGSHHSGKF